MHISDSRKYIVDVTVVDEAGKIREMNYVSFEGAVDLKAAWVSDVGTIAEGGGRLIDTKADGLPDAECASHVEVDIKSFVLNEGLRKFKNAEVCGGRPVTDSSKDMIKLAQSSLDTVLKSFRASDAVVCNLIGEKSGGTAECNVGKTITLVLNDNDKDGKPEHASIRLFFPYTSEIFSMSVSNYPINLIKGANELYDNATPKEEPKDVQPPLEDEVLDHS